MTELCAILLAAGYGTRLRPLTDQLPKPLCPVGNQPILGRSLNLVEKLGLRGPTTVAVNTCWLGDQVARYLAGRAHLSPEDPPPLGTSGAVAKLREWTDGRAVLVGNTDAYLAGVGLDPLIAGWDGQTVRLLGVPAAPGADAFGRHQFAGFSLLPASWVARLPTTRAELVHTVWRPAEAAGALEVIEYPGYFQDTGTPADYLAANRHAAATDPRRDTRGNLIAPGAVITGECHDSVIGASAKVFGRLTRSVVWPGGFVGPAEHLIDAVRAGPDLTVGTG
ncbi:NTP transferase domain-containing protein [Natronosporangium hydrolyticum]|uniref:NTP transferase domain-containing protein n=1 Tax=Natronosporangium hydrolyticum TaxID=2811111 RepID=A0A895YEI2_9ACTN|nr:sugar phosphate nucleotidyltransferase [Natronosporangium hydrolyticum]QSB16207.1 NTP transferase domain-containing protein [Natronosporangium hydrolyticum]